MISKINGDYPIDKSYIFRYILDGFTLNMSGGIARVSEGFTRSFSTIKQAQQMLGIANTLQPVEGKFDGFNFSIGNHPENVTGGVAFNYRDETDLENLYAYTLESDFNFNGTPGHLSVRVGDLIYSRLRDNPNATELTIDPSNGQLVWKA